MTRMSLLAIDLTHFDLGGALAHGLLQFGFFESLFNPLLQRREVE